MFFRTHESVSDEEISFDMEHFNTELDNMKEEVTREGGKEEELVQMVTNIIFTVLWRGKTGRTRKEALVGLYNNQGLAIASINMLALNNKLYTSHALLKRKLTELCIQAILSDLKKKKKDMLWNLSNFPSSSSRQMLEGTWKNCCPTLLTILLPPPSQLLTTSSRHITSSKDDDNDPKKK